MTAFEPEYAQELQQLLNQLCDEGLEPAAMSRLDEILNTHPAARQEYVAFMRVNAQLMWRYRTGDLADRVAEELAQENVASEREAVTTADVSPSQSRQTDDQASPNRAARRLSGRITVGLLLLTIVGFGMLLQFAGNGLQQGGTTANHGAGFIATLRISSGIVWFNEHTPVNVGERIEPGTIVVDQGEAELVFDSGARVIVSGPAELRLDSPLAAHLEYGDIVAHMPEAAVGFQLSTDSANYIDRGTEFGLHAEEDGSSEVHVFRGQVDVHPYLKDTSQQKPIEVVHREAMRVAAAGQPAAAIEYSKSRFGPIAARISEPISWPMSESGNGHFYQLVVTSSPIIWQEAAAQATHRYHRGMRGHLATITSPEEHDFVVERILSETDHRGVWLGMTDVLREGDFRWVTQEPFDYTKWASQPTQQPDNFIEAIWHGGEDYGMYSKVQPHVPWEWNDLSIDSMHENVYAYLIEYEPAESTEHYAYVTGEPIVWPKEQGGNGHLYQLALSYEPVSWEVIRDRADQTEFQGRPGHLVVLESDEETNFIIDEILRVCGIPQVAVGASCSRSGEINWIDGASFEHVLIEKPRLPDQHLFGFLNWTTVEEGTFGWRIQLRDMPSGWFGYLIEYED